MMIKVRQIKVDVKKDSYYEVKLRCAEKLKVRVEEIQDMILCKKSIDARDKENVCYVYEVNVLIVDEKKYTRRKNKDIDKYKEIKYKKIKVGNENLEHRPIIVGSGPSGLFAALLLAEYGYRPLVLERGEKVDERIKTVEEFWNTGKLNPESNVSFGEGGAGTFSDGKLNTMVNDKEGRIKKIFDTFIKCGAPSDIAIDSKPHVGTDVLRDVIINLRNMIIFLGGEIRYNSCVTDVEVIDGSIKSVLINNSERIESDVCIFAIGHSARDTIEMLYNKGIFMCSKAFAVGVRIQHPQSLINESQYGKFSKYLPNASYKLTHNASNKRGVYSFCMCPGGYVVNSSCEEGHLMINGMSYNDRNSGNANSAIVVTVGPDDFGPDPMDGIEYQRKLECLAYRKGNGKIPVQLLKDYIDGKVSDEFLSVKPLFKGEYSFADLNDIFPYYVNEALKEGIINFDKKIKGFAMDDAILAGIESRTSSAVRVNRNEECVSNIEGIYPCGEGCGYSGGIITSCIDGIKVSEKIIRKYSKKNIK